MNQESLFSDAIEHASTKPASAQWQKHRVLVTVKAAPNPSSTHGETVCVAGVLLGDTGPRGWVPLYPINFRHLPDKSAQFKKYDIVRVDCRPAGEPRVESWKPNMTTLVRESHVPPWAKRRPLIDRLIEESMCRVRADAASDPTAPSLSLIRPAEVLDLQIARHPGWTEEEQAKIDAYVGQLDLFDGQDKSPLVAPASSACTNGGAAVPAATRTSSASWTGSSWPCNGTYGRPATSRRRRRSGRGSCTNFAHMIEM